MLARRRAGGQGLAEVRGQQDVDPGVDLRARGSRARSSRRASGSKAAGCCHEQQAARHEARGVEGVAAAAHLDEEGVEAAPAWPGRTTGSTASGETSAVRTTQRPRISAPRHGAGDAAQEAPGRQSREHWPHSSRSAGRPHADCRRLLAHRARRPVARGRTMVRARLGRKATPRAALRSRRGPDLDSKDAVREAHRATPLALRASRRPPLPRPCRSDPAPATRSARCSSSRSRNPASATLKQHPLRLPRGHARDLQHFPARPAAPSRARSTTPFRDAHQSPGRPPADAAPIWNTSRSEVNDRGHAVEARTLAQAHPRSEPRPPA